MRVLITIFDALRPDLVTPERMPNLCRFAADGVRFSRSRSTYPTETRVNQSAVTTGCMPARHGVVGNTFLAPELLGGRLLNSGDDQLLEEAVAAGQVLGVPNLGQRLTAAGKRFASLSAGTPGGGRLINWSAELDGTLRFAMKRPEAAVPTSLHDQLISKIGPLPEYTLPGVKWIDWAVAAYLDVIEPEHQPDAMLLWLCEPDESFHWHAIGSDESVTAMRAVDAAFGRILAHHADEIARGDMQIIALSDHGQITLSGPRISLVDELRKAGFNASRTDLAGNDAAVAVANGGGIWLRDSSRTEELVDWFLRQPWCGPLFTKDGALGTLHQAELRGDHARAPDVTMIFQAEDTANAHGVPGLTLHDAPYPEGGGCHGGLSQWELHNFLAMGGGAFRKSVVVDAPVGNIDILPTVMRLLELETPNDIDGRPLDIAMMHGEEVSDEPTSRILRSQNTTGPVTELHVTDLGPARYLDTATAR